MIKPQAYLQIIYTNPLLFYRTPYTLIGKNDAPMTNMTHLSNSITFVVQIQLLLN
jgi:hypothetical protein